MKFVGILPEGQEIVDDVPPYIYVIAPVAPLPIPDVFVIFPDDVVACLPLPELSRRVVPDQSSAK